MKKKVLALLLATAMIATFAGCGDNAVDDNYNNEVVDNQGGEEEESITCTLTVWSPSEYQSEEKGQWLQTQCEAFSAEHPNWNITFNYGVCAEGDAKTTITQDVDAAADVFCFANDHLADLIAAGAIAELGGSAAEYVTSNFGATYVNSISDNGAVYGIPYEPNTYMMYYNTSVYSADDVKSLETMIEKGVVMFPMSNGFYNAAFFLATGAEFFGNVNDNDAGINLGGDNATKAVDYMIDLAANKNFKNGEFQDAVSGLKDGSIAAAVGGTWSVADAKEALGDNYGVAVLPTINVDGKDCQMKAFAGSKAFGVKATTEYPQVATALALFLASETAQQAKYEALSNLPALASLADVIKDEIVIGVVGDVYASGSIMQPYCANMGNWWTPAANLGTEIVAGDVTHADAAAKAEALSNAVNGN